MDFFFGRKKIKVNIKFPLNFIKPVFQKIYFKNCTYNFIGGSTVGLVADSNTITIVLESST